MKAEGSISNMNLIKSIFILSWGTEQSQWKLQTT
jgi:hypothetical protein